MFELTKVYGTVIRVNDGYLERADDSLIRSCLPFITEGETAKRWRYVVDQLGPDAFVRDGDFHKARSVEPCADGVDIRHGVLLCVFAQDAIVARVSRVKGDMVLASNGDDRQLQQMQARLVLAHPDIEFRKDSDYDRVMKWVPVQREDGVYMGDHRVDVPVTFSDKQERRRKFYEALKSAGVAVP